MRPCLKATPQNCQKTEKIMELEDWQVLLGVATNNTTNLPYENFVNID